MARMKVKIDRNALRMLMQNESLVAGRTEAVRAACESESSWDHDSGGYGSSVKTDGIRARGTVWSFARQDGSGSTERANRLIRNLDAGG